MDEGRPLAVFDVDGVLADVRHRLPLLASQPKDWDGFFAAAPADPPLAVGVALCQQHAATCDVVYVTGRPETCRADTLAWLDRHGLPAGPVSMRRRGDRRPARVAKPELLRSLAAGRTVAVVVDDDEQVCRAYTAAGWPVLLADWMTRPELLAEAQQEEGRT